jgi:hypothetical protein
VSLPRWALVSYAGCHGTARPCWTDASAVHRWLQGLQLFHAARFAVMAAVVGVTIVTGVVQPQCTLERPCGPSAQSTWMLALFFGPTLIAIGTPGMGCLSALALGF